MANNYMLLIFSTKILQKPLVETESAFKSRPGVILGGEKTSDPFLLLSSYMARYVVKMWMRNCKARSEDVGSLLQATGAQQSQSGSEFTEGASLNYSHIRNMLPGAHCGRGSDGSTSRRSRQ